MVGLSSNPFRPSHFAAIYLISEGYDVIPVNPRESQVLGRSSYPSLAAIPGPVEVVNIFREPAAVPAIVEEAIAIGAKVVWMQLGVIHEEAAERARAAGLEVVMDRCMKIEHARFFGGSEHDRHEHRADHVAATGAVAESRFPRNDFGAA